MSIIENLKKMTPHERAASIQKMFAKNRAFFEKTNPKIAAVIVDGGYEPYHINIDKRFLSIYDKRTEELCHPEVGLDRFAEYLGGWTNQAWIDLIEGRIHVHSDTGPYSKMPQRYNQGLLTQFPGLISRIKKREINLPELKNGKHFSNSVVFVGVFHGLHIDYYLNRTQVINAAFIEPEVPRFVLSCCFLDYESLDQQFGGLILHVGNEFPHQHVNRFFKNSRLTSSVWVRVLPGYASDKVEPLMREFRLKWRNFYDVWAPPEDVLAGMDNVAANIALGKPVCCRTAKLSSGSRIAVVGAGPSLTADLLWLKEHHDQFIIFAAHSSVSTLLSHGIRPDFQFNIEIRPWTDEIFKKLDLNKSIPIVTMLNDIPDKFSDFSDVLLLPEMGGVYPVKVQTELPFLAPTTGNVALGFACHCQPEEIYLFGMDFGFRSAVATHVESSMVYAEEADHKRQLGSSQLQVDPNFAEASELYTQPYFNLARQSAQQAIHFGGKRAKFYNCADGARIEGATPCHSADIELIDYDKSEDIEAIRSMFSPLEEGEHWQHLELSGKEQLAAFKKLAIKEMKMGRFNWLKFVQHVDNFRENITKQLPRKVAEHKDARILPYLAVMDELLVSWYRLLCFTNNEDEWQRVYKAGYEKFVELVEEMEWEIED